MPQKKRSQTSLNRSQSNEEESKLRIARDGNEGAKLSDRLR